MKSLINEIFLISIPFALWIFCFFNFFNGHLPLQDDAISYADHIRFYTDNLSKGIFPFWDPTWYSGVPNNFFLRRIGDVNPLLYLIVFLKWFGVSSASAYLVFLAAYYFLAGWAFYLIARFLFADTFFAFAAYILFLFSSWGSEVFYNYIIIIFVPIIWFFYFLLSFAREAKKGPFLGMFFCAGLIVTTYIPFFFVTILAVFSALYVLFYPRECLGFLRHSFVFVNKNRFFTVFCIVFLLCACMPALHFYKESKSGEFVLPGRHLGSDSSSAVAVGLTAVSSGDLISHGYFDRIFDDQANIDMGDIYVPYIFFIILLTTLCARVNKLVFFLLFNILIFSFITITSASGIHHFLYKHVMFFKYIRNIYYIFWLAMLPMGIFLSVSAFKSLLEAIDASSRKTAWLVYIMACHLVFMVFLCSRQGVLGGAWVAVAISMVYFLVYFFCKNKMAYLAGFALLLASVCVQSAQVYSFLDKKVFQAGQKAVEDQQLRPALKTTKLSLYYASHWFAVLVEYIDPQILEDYRDHPFILYDNVLPYRDSPEFFKTLQTVWAADTNIAFLPATESSSGDWKKNPAAPRRADVDPVLSRQLKVLHSDANTFDLSAHLSSAQFLVVNDNYNSDWHAFINGHPAHVFRANFSFKGLWVPSGDSHIVLHYLTFKRYLFHMALMVFFALTLLYLLVLFKKCPCEKRCSAQPKATRQSSYE